MGENLNLEAELRIKVASQLDKLITEAGETQEALGGASKGVDQIERALDGLKNKVSGTADGMKKLTTSTSASNKAATEGSKEWQKYVDALGKANQAYRDFRQGEVTGLGGGTDVSSMTDGEMSKYLSTYEAMNASVIGAIRERQSAERAASESEEQRIAGLINAQEALIARQRERVELARQLKIAEDTAAIKSSNSAFMGGVESRVGYAPTGQRAANTGLADILRAEDLKASTQAGRDYLNVSTDIDGAIKQREQSSRSFSQQLQAQMQAEAGVTDGLIAQRYALYDVATTYGAVSAALLGVTALTIGAGASFESSFTNVERTSTASAGAIAGIREELVDMSTEIPRSFDEITQAATLGNQLGIASDELTGFTDTAIKFAAVTGLSVEASATAFGSLGELLNITESDYERLGSSIALVGRLSVATEAEIVSMSTRLAASASNAGFTAQEVIALSGAFASLRIAPERAQGVMEVYFKSLNSAIAEGGDKLQAFADVTGMSQQQVADMVATDPTAFFRRLAEGLNSFDPIQQTVALDALGLSGIRAGEVFGRVANNLGVFDEALMNSSKGWTENDELARQYALVLDDMNTQLQLLWQSLSAVAAAGGAELIPGLAVAVEHLTHLVNNFRGFAETDAGGVFIKVGVAITTVLGLFAGYAAMTSLATASTYALITAQQGLAKSGSAGGLMGLIGAMKTLRTVNAEAAVTGGRVAATNAGVGAASRMGAAGVAILSGALRALTRVILPLLIISTLIELVFNFNGTMQVATGVLAEFTNFLGEVYVNVANFMNGLGSAVPVIGVFTNALSGLYSFLGKNVPKGGQMIKEWGDNLSTDEVEDFGAANEALDYSQWEGDAGDYSSAIGGVGDSAAGAAAEVRTLVDYGNDLQQVFDRSFDIRFGGGEAFDGITTGWIAISEAIAATNAEIADYRVEMLALSSDKAIREYWLSVAENYGDALRAGELRAEIAEIDQNLKTTSEALSKAQDKNSQTLVGNSSAAIENRAELLGLVGGYQDYIAKLASSGMSQADLQTTAARLKQEFIAQATQLGYNSAEVLTYAAAFDDVTTAINGVPRNITVTAHTDPAMQALAEMQSRLQSIANGNYSPSITPTFNDDAMQKQARLQVLMAQLAAATAEYNNALKSGADNVVMRASERMASINARIQSGSYREGGYTGNGGVNDVAGAVHGREFVFSAPAVKNIGVENLAYAHNMAKSGRPASIGNGGGSGLGGGTTVVELSAYDRQLLADAGNLSVTIPGVAIAKAVSNNNVNGSSRGKG